MKQFLILLLLNLIIFNAFPQTTKWRVDTLHSSVSFTIKHFKVAEVEGKFTSFGGLILSDKPDFTDAKIDFWVHVNSLNTKNGMRDRDLKSDEFFDVKKYPKMTFVSKSMKKISVSAYELSGKLNIHGISHEVNFKLGYSGTVKDAYGNTIAGFKATNVVNRYDYGLSGNKLTQIGAAKEVNIILNVELIKMK